MSTSEEVLHGRLQWLMFLRVVVATFLLGATVLLEVRETQGLLKPPLLGFYALTATTYLLTLVYVYLLKRVRNLQGFAYVQIVVDLLLETVLVYLTGLEESVFSSIYNMSIITGSILLYRRGGLVTASLSSMLYGGLLDLRFYGALPAISWGMVELSGGVRSEIFYTILVNLSAFFLVAFLSSYLAEQVRISQRELEETQSDLSELTAIHENILQCLHSGLLTADLQGRITFANQSASEILGIPLADLQRSSLPSLFPGLASNILGGTADDPHPPEVYRESMDYKRPDAAKLHLGFSLTPLRSAGGARTGTIVHFQDLTQTIAMEEHLRRVDRLATIGELAARIAHEIRNPLASLSGSIQILQNELRVEGPNRRLMEIVTRETRRLNTLLTDFLLFARPEQLQIQEMDLSRDLQETLALFMEQERDGPRVEVDSQIAPALKIEADPKKMRQIFWNLLNNALEAMPHGGKLRVSARWAVESGDHAACDGSSWLLLEVQDTGVGIPPELQDRIYDPFFTTKDRGTGLGLSMVHRSLENLGGRIEVDSQPGEGTRFSLWMPKHPRGTIAERRRRSVRGGEVRSLA